MPSVTMPWGLTLAQQERKDRELKKKNVRIYLVRYLMISIFFLPDFYILNVLKDLMEKWPNRKKKQFH